MAIETEIKAVVEDPERLASALSGVGNYCYSYHKADSYWTLPRGNPGRLRIRNEEKTFPDGQSSRSIIVTFKTREFYGEMEVNNEREFTVSDSSVFEEILTQLGLEPDIKKEKRGRAWKLEAANNAPSVLAELSLVTHLGHYIELEILNDTHDEQTLRQTHSRLLALLEQLGIPRQHIEVRPYTAMLRELQ